MTWTLKTKSDIVYIIYVKTFKIRKKSSFGMGGLVRMQRSNMLFGMLDFKLRFYQA